jgi:hypothetical protein
VCDTTSDWCLDRGHGAFDVSLALGRAISYCLDRADVALRELCRVTRPGGMVGLSVMSLYGTLHRFLPGVLALPIEINREVLSTGDLSRDVNDGHECHLFRVAELRGLLRDGGLEVIEVHASGWLVPNGEMELPEPGSEACQMLLAAGNQREYRYSWRWHAHDRVGPRGIETD